MILLSVIRKIALFFLPLVISYLLRRMGKEHAKRKSRMSDFDKSKIVDGEIVEGK